MAIMITEFLTEILTFDIETHIMIILCHCACWYFHVNPSSLPPLGYSMQTVEFELFTLEKWVKWCRFNRSLALGRYLGVKGLTTYMWTRKYSLLLMHSRFPCLETLIFQFAFHQLQTLHVYNKLSFLGRCDIPEWKSCPVSIDIAIATKMLRRASK